MELEKVKKRTIFQRLRNFILGDEKPNLLTRISVWSGFIVWLYLFSWQLLTGLSILLSENLDNSDRIKAHYKSVGSKFYGFSDTFNWLYYHSIIQIVIYLLILTSLILIWRKKKIGFLLFVGGNVLSLVITFFMMGLRFMIKEIPVIDYILIITTTLYFAVGIFIFYRKKKRPIEPLS